MDDRHRYTYTSHYCEENVCLLAAEALAQSLPQPLERAYAVFVTSESRRTCVWHQRLSERPSELPVCWDYHVVLLTLPSSKIYDFDHAGAFVTGAREYCRLSFEPATVSRSTYLSAPPQLFRVVSAEFFVKGFSSDRSHMKGSGVPPPPYPCLRGEAASSDMNLFEYLRCDDLRGGEVTLEDVEAAGALGVMMSKDRFLLLL